MAANLEALPERVESIERKLDSLSVSVDERFEQVDKRFEQVDRRLEQIDRRFDEVTTAIVEQREYTEFAFGSLKHEMTAGFDRLDRRITIEVGRLERKIDQLLEGQRLAASRSRPPRSRKR